MISILGISEGGATMRKILLLAAAVMLLGVGNVQAQTVDPQVFACTQIAGVCQGANDPFTINLSSVTLGFQGSFTSHTDFFVIVGIPNGVSVPTITCNSGCTSPAGPSGVAIMTSTGITGVSGNGVSTSTSPINAYEAFSNITCCDAGQKSQSFGNWTQQTFPNGTSNPDFGVTSFTLYEFDLGASSQGQGSVNISVNNAPAGTWVIGYVAEACNSTKSNCAIGPNSTPFTVGGVSRSVPEHATVTLLGAGLLGLAGLFGRRKKQVK
jgi:LPXTG-motif cell wall-anchored protein